MAILSADNPLWPFIQIYDKRTKRQLQNVLWYDTQTGEGSFAPTVRTQFEHLGNINFNLFQTNAGDGKILTGNFIDAGPNNLKDVVISIPRKLYDEYKHYIQTLLLNPVNNGKITLRFVDEYIANSREDPDYKETFKT